MCDGNLLMDCLIGWYWLVLECVLVCLCVVVLIVVVLLVGMLVLGICLGLEFLFELDEGLIWLIVMLDFSISLVEV